MGKVNHSAHDNEEFMSSDDWHSETETVAVHEVDSFQRDWDIVLRNSRRLKLRDAADKAKKAASKAKLAAGKAAGKVRAKANAARRKIITGDPNKRVRDFMRETPKRVKFVDKVSFTYGVLSLLLTHFVLMKLQGWFAWYYAVTFVVQVGVRFFVYRKHKWHFFMLDFCYFTNLLLLYHVFLQEKNIALFRALFIMTNGPLTVAMITWRNSLVFHSLDKITSVFIHALPALATFSLRWQGNEDNHWRTDRMLTAEDGVSRAFDTVLNATLLYMMWQIAYWMLTEWIFRGTLARDKNVATSMRWFVRDRRGALRAVALRVVRRLGILSPEEDLHEDDIRTQFTFMLSQLIYTWMTLIAPVVFYDFEIAHIVYLIGILLVCIWNGASFYIEVFSRRYMTKFEFERLTFEM
ncbi:MAG: hypothetical protein MHM6MM_003545 [Cercozoa sp. M6MM]